VLNLFGIAQEKPTVPDNTGTNVEAYYFHFTSRCETCRAVESVSSEALKAMDIELKSLNIDKDVNMEIAKKIGADGQALILTNGVKTINLTTDGFMYALSDPERLKTKVQKAVEQLEE
jgi:hypothetical protein